MYHIKNDRRQIKTADKLTEALKQCLFVKTMSEISVSDISDKAGVSRSSFYRSFDTPADVLSYACDRTVLMLEKDYADVNLADRYEFVLFSLRYWSQHTDILEAAVNCDRLDIVQKCISSHSELLLVDELRDIYNEFSESEMEYLRMGLTGLLSNIIIVWIRHGKKETPEQLYKIYCKLRALIG